MTATFRIICILPLLLICASLFAQWAPLSSLTDGIEWQEGCVHNGHFVGLASATNKQYLVQGDSVIYLTASPHNRLASDGSELLLLDAEGILLDKVVDLATYSLQDGVVIYGRDVNPNRLVRLYDALPATGNSLALYSSRTNYLSAFASPEHGMVGPNRVFPAPSDISYYGRGYEYQNTGFIISRPVGLARRGSEYIGVSRIPGFDRTLAYGYGWTVYDGASDRLNSMHFELRGEVVSVLAYQQGYILTTNSEVLITDELGNPLRVFNLPEQVKLIDAAVDNAGTGFVAVLETSSGNILGHATAAAGFDAVFETTDPDTRIEHIYYESNLGYRIEAVCGTALCFEEFNGPLSDATLLSLQLQGNISFPSMVTYPFPDTVGSPAVFRHEESHPDILDYPVFVDYTLDSNVYIQIRGEREIRSKSGQLLQVVSEAPALDTSALLIEWESRLRLDTGRVLLDKVDGTIDTLLLNIPWDGSSSTSTTRISALPNGQIIAKRQTGFFRGNPFVRHLILDTLGTIISDLEGNSYDYEARPQGLLIYGKRSFTDRVSSYSSTTLGYTIVPYRTLQRPIDLPLIVPYCTESDSVSYTNPLTGLVETQLIGNRKLVQVNGLNFQIERPPSSLLINIIDTVIIEAFCRYATLPRQFEVHLRDSAAVATVLANGEPLEEYEYIDTRTIQLTIIDTNGCELYRRVYPETDYLFFSTRDACFGENNGSIYGSEDSVVIDGIVRSLPVTDLMEGSYSMQLYSNESNCFFDTLVQIQSRAEIQFDTTEEYIGNEVRFSVSVQDTTLPAFFMWSTGETSSSILVTLGDTVTLTTRVLQCERIDTFIARRTVPTLDANSLTARIYPNPVRNKLSINVSAPVTGIVINRLGQTVQTFALEAGTNHIGLDMLSAGLYHLHLLNEREEHSFTLVKLD